MEKTEAKIQQEITQWYRNTYCLRHHSPRNVIFSVPNESKDVAEAGYKRAIGLFRGASDLVVVQKGEVVFVEVKTPTGTQSKEQKEFESIVKALGFRYEVVRSLEQFKTIVE